MHTSLSDQEFRLDGKVAVVTGASSGIGAEIARHFASAGAHLVLHYSQNREGVEETAKAIRQTGREALILQTDFAAEQASQGCQNLVEQAWSWRGGIDVWVNNAGADVLTTTAATWSFEQKLARLWQVDVLATLRLSRLVLTQMQTRPDQAKGVILNVGWDQAEFGMAGDSGEMFATTKGAIMSFSRSLAQSAGPRVRVHCLAPGWIQTSWGEQASSYWQERASAESLRGRWGTPTDVARVARFLASDAADFLGSVIVPVNGGWQRASDR